ncbi:MAG: bifunctional isocitrate dehydrogenase kinase/phosphatase [Alphaproteobacteria bacterium]|nr:bifunctional isocitrate dehydrogenase kinase/phosphatase [Alphaproteobacteria bacterium]
MNLAPPPNAAAPTDEEADLWDVGVDPERLRALEQARSEPEKVALIAALIFDVFGDYYARSRAMPAAAKAAFENMDWTRSIDISRERLIIYTRSISRLAPLLKLFCREVESRDAFWEEVERAYLALIAGHYQADVAFAFLSSVRRKIYQDQWKAVEYTYGAAGDAALPPTEILREFPGGPSVLPETVAAILQVPDFTVPYGDLAGDAARIAERIDATLGLPAADGVGIVAIRIIDAGFYRNRGAYIVGRIDRQNADPVPLAIALLNEGEGIFVDAVILDGDHLQYLFSSTLANFHVTCNAYHELSRFLHGLMPKRPLGLHYSTIGFNHVGKVTVMREIESQIVGADERMDRAVGFPGTVAIGFSAPSSEFVLKVIRNKPTANYKWGTFPGIDAVLGQYRRVHDINRTGSMLDNIVYYNVTLPRAFFADALLEELLVAASENVSLYLGNVVFRHLIVQMKMSPLPVFLETAPPTDAETAVRNLGQCIKNNAAANIFNRDLDGRNYGVSKILKVYLYDYDAIEPLTEVKIRSNLDRIDGEEDVPDWFFEEGFVFLPEEMEVGLRIDDRNLRRLFREVHGDLMTSAYWTRIQERLRDGRVPRIHTYPAECRLRV